MTADFRRSPLALAILGLLENGPMHPYGIQRLIRQWGKDQVVNDRLEEAGFITAGGTERDERYPERTTYHLTGTGRAVSRQWLAEIISAPRNEFPEFPAALSFLMLLTPGTAGELLGHRRDLLAQRIADLDAELTAEFEGAPLPRVALVEIEYLHAVTSAELRWVTAIRQALADGSLTWDSP